MGSINYFLKVHFNRVLPKLLSLRKNFIHEDEFLDAADS